MTLKNDFQGEGGALLLAAAILDQAKDDYVAAIMANDKRSIASLERFFLSAWGQELSFCQGELIMEKCRKIADERIERRHRRRKRDKMKQNE